MKRREDQGRFGAPVSPWISLCVRFVLVSPGVGPLLSVLAPDDDSATGCSTVTLLPTCLHTFGKQSIKQGRGRGVQGNQVEQGHHMRSLIPSTWGCFQAPSKLNIFSMCYLYRGSFVTPSPQRLLAQNLNLGRVRRISDVRRRKTKKEKEIIFRRTRKTENENIWSVEEKKNRDGKWGGKCNDGGQPERQTKRHCEDSARILE